jgi:plastocyanin
MKTNIKTNILSLVLIFAIVLFVFGCGAKTTEPQQTTDQEVVTVPTLPQPVPEQASEMIEIVVETSSETEEAEDTVDNVALAAPATVEVDIKNYSFDDNTVTVNVGDTVVWENYDSTAHTVSGNGLDSGTMNEGDTWEYRFIEPGTYTYYCA